MIAGNKIGLRAVEKEDLPLLRDWRKKDPEAYNGALRLNIVKEVSNHMKRIWEKKYYYH